MRPFSDETYNPDVEDNSVVLYPDDPFDAIIIRMVETNRKKRKDYAGAGHYLANFYDSASQLQQSAGHSVETLIATKQARLKTLLPNLWNGLDGPANESIEDTLLDRAVYSVLALCIWNQQGYASEGLSDDSVNRT